jgi:hypothetical protein
VRVLKPCTGDPSKWGQDCQWFDDASVMSMQAERWYSTAESLGDGSVVLIGGMTGGMPAPHIAKAMLTTFPGGYINRNYPNTDCNEGGGAENSFEFWPSRGPKVFSPFLCKTSGLNTYPHAFLMPSGKMFLQANYSTSTSLGRALIASLTTAQRSWTSTLTLRRRCRTCRTRSCVCTRPPARSRCCP